MKPHLLALAPFVFASGLSAQDMVAVAWSGDVYTLDSRTAALKKIGNGLFGQNAAAVDNAGNVWSTSRTGASPTWVYNLTKVDPNTGVGTLIHKGIPDVRGMARGDPYLLWCIVNGDPDSLYSLNVITGAYKRIGSTGVRGLTGLALHQGKLFTWSLSIGLMTLDRVTGKATRVGSTGGGGGSEIQFLASRSDGMLIGGKKDLFQIDPITGVAKLIGKMPANADLRGAEEWFGNWSPIGTGCKGTYGTVSLVVSGKLQPGGQIYTTSYNHAVGSIGFLILGASRSQFLSLPLPLSVDPIFGTVGCSLYVSFDIVLPAIVESKAPARMIMRVGLPANASGRDVHVQHMVFESVPGKMSWSNGATIHIRY